MTKDEFIDKYGEKKYEERLKYKKEHKVRAEEKAELCVTVDFNTPLPTKEPSESRDAFKIRLLRRGNELAYHFQRLIGFKWYKDHKEECIVIVDPLISKGEYRFRVEFYVLNVVPELKEWLVETVKDLDYE